MLINLQPLLYLGRDKVSGAYYFLSSKGGEGRFLKYLSYPYWCLASNLGNLLDLTAELPDEVMQDVIQFVNGTIRYEIVPAKQGRKERVLKHSISQPPSETIVLSSGRPVGAAAHGQGKSGPSTGDGQISTPRTGNSTSDTNVEPEKRRGRPRKSEAPDPSRVEETQGGMAESGTVEDRKTSEQVRATATTVWPFPRTIGVTPNSPSKGAQAKGGSSLVQRQGNVSTDAGERTEISGDDSSGERGQGKVSRDGALLAGSGGPDELQSEASVQHGSSRRGLPISSDVLEQFDLRRGRGVDTTAVVTPAKKRGRPAGSKNKPKVPPV